MQTIKRIRNNVLRTKRRSIMLVSPFNDQHCKTSSKPENVDSQRHEQSKNYSFFTITPLQEEVYQSYFRGQNSIISENLTKNQRPRLTSRQPLKSLGASKLSAFKTMMSTSEILENDSSMMARTMNISLRHYPSQKEKEQHKQQNLAKKLKTFRMRTKNTMVLYQEIDSMQKRRRSPLKKLSRAATVEKKGELFYEPILLQRKSSISPWQIEQNQE